MKLLLLLLALSLLFLANCSTKSASSGNSITIRLEEDTAKTFAVFPSLLTSTPSATSDFDCFTVNVTGSGLAPDSDKFQGCTSSTNMEGRGFGRIANPVRRGVPITLELPGGPNRAIDVYGIYPSIPECTGGETVGGSKGYFLGGVVKNLVQSMSVTIPISLAPGTPGAMTCTGGGGSSSFTVIPNGTSGKAFSAASIQATVNTSLPAPGTASTEHSGADYTSIGTNDGSLVIFETSGSGNHIVEYHFYVSYSTLTQYYNNFDFTWVGKAGTTASCIAATPSGGTGMTVQAYNYNSSLWENIASPTTTVTTLNATLTTLANYFHPGFGGIIFRVVGGTAGASCSTVHTDFVQGVFRS